MGSVLDRLFCVMAEDWQRLKLARQTVHEVQDRLRQHAARASALGSPTKRTARCTEIPETNLHRWSRQASEATEGEAAA